MGVHAQVIGFWIYDTSKVVCFYSSAAYIPDTVAYLKPKLDSLTSTNTVVIYWDQEKKHKYQELLPGGKNNRITYYRNGQIDEQCLYYDASGNSLKENYLWSAWYPDGNKKGEMIFEGKKKSIVYYYHNGQVRWKDVSIMGADPKRPKAYQYVFTENFCENGQLISKDSINSTSIRKFTRYFCNGQKEREFTWNGLNVIGPWIQWYSNGKIAIEGQYPATLPLRKEREYGSTKQQGTWKYYDDKGKLIKEEIYKDGVVLETKNY